MKPGRRTGAFALALFLVAAPAAIAQPPIDFSYAGYAGGGVDIPKPRTVIFVRPTGADDTGPL